MLRIPSDPMRTAIITFLKFDILYYLDLAYKFVFKIIAEPYASSNIVEMLCYEMICNAML